MKTATKVAGFTAEGVFVKLSVPAGMDAALQGLTREVLRHQPADIYWFAAQYFENLIRSRAGETTSIRESHTSKGTSRVAKTSSVKYSGNVASLAATTGTVAVLAAASASHPSAPPWEETTRVEHITTTQSSTTLSTVVSQSESSQMALGNDSGKTEVTSQSSEDASQHEHGAGVVKSQTGKSTKKRNSKTSKEKEGKTASVVGSRAHIISIENNKVESDHAIEKYGEMTSQVSSIVQEIAHDTVLKTKEISMKVSDLGSKTEHAIEKGKQETQEPLTELQTNNSKGKRGTRRLRRQTKSVDSSSDISEKADRFNLDKTNNSTETTIEKDALSVTLPVEQTEKASGHIAADSIELKSLHGSGDQHDVHNLRIATQELSNRNETVNLSASPMEDFAHQSSYKALSQEVGENFSELKAEEVCIQSEGSVRKSSKHDILQETCEDGSHKTVEEKAEETKEEKHEAREKTSLERKSNVQVDENGGIVEEEITITTTEQSLKHETTVSKSWTMETTIETLADGETRVIERMIIHSPPPGSAADLEKEGMASGEGNHVKSDLEVTEEATSQALSQTTAETLESSEGVYRDSIVTTTNILKDSPLINQAATDETKEFGIVDATHARKSIEKIGAALQSAEKTLEDVTSVDEVTNVSIAKHSKTDHNASEKGLQLESSTTETTKLEDATTQREFGLIDLQDAKKSLEQITNALSEAEESFPLQRSHGDAREISNVQQSDVDEDGKETFHKVSETSNDRHADVDENGDELLKEGTVYDRKITVLAGETLTSIGEAANVSLQSEILKTDALSETTEHISTVESTSNSSIILQSETGNGSDRILDVPDTSVEKMHQKIKTDGPSEVDDNLNGTVIESTKDVTKVSRNMSNSSDASLDGPGEVDENGKVRSIVVQGDFKHSPERVVDTTASIDDTVDTATKTEIIIPLDETDNDKGSDLSKEGSKEDSSSGLKGVSFHGHDYPTDEDQATPRDDVESLRIDTPEDSTGTKTSSGSEENGDPINPPTVVISRTADVIELKDGELNIVTQMEKEGLVAEGLPGDFDGPVEEIIITKGALQTLSEESSDHNSSPKISPKIVALSVVAASTIGLIDAEKEDAEHSQPEYASENKDEEDTVEIIAADFDHNRFIHEEIKHSNLLLGNHATVHSRPQDVGLVRTDTLHTGTALSFPQHSLQENSDSLRQSVSHDEAHSDFVEPVKQAVNSTTHAHESEIGKHVATSFAAVQPIANVTDIDDSVDVDETGKPIPVDENGKPMYSNRTKRAVHDDKDITVANDIIPDKSAVQLSRSGSIVAKESENNHWYGSQMSTAGSTLIKPALAMSRDPALETLHPCDEPECIAVDVRVKDKSGIQSTGKEGEQTSPVARKGIDVMKEMSLVTSRIGQSIISLGSDEAVEAGAMAMETGDPPEPKRSDSQESFIISADAVYIPLNPPGMKQPHLERIDSIPSVSGSVQEEFGPGIKHSTELSQENKNSELSHHSQNYNRGVGTSSPRTYTVTEPRSTSAYVEHEIEDGGLEVNQDDDVLIVEYPTDPLAKVTKWDNVVVASAEMKGDLLAKDDAGRFESLPNEPQSYMSVDDSLQDLPSLQDEAVVNVESESELLDSMPEEEVDRKWTDDVVKIAHKAHGAAKGLFSRNGVSHDDENNIQDPNIHGENIMTVPKDAVLDTKDSERLAAEIFPNEAVTSSKTALQTDTVDSSALLDDAKNTQLPKITNETALGTTAEINSSETSIESNVKAVGHGLIDSASRGLTSVKSSIEDTKGSIESAIVSTRSNLSSGVHHVEDKVSKVQESVVAGSEGIIAYAEETINEAAHQGQSTVSKKLSGIEESFGAALGHAEDSSATALDAFKSKTSKALTGVRDEITKTVEIATDKTSEAGQDIKTKAVDTVLDVKDSVLNVVGNVENSISKAVEVVKDKTSEAHETYEETSSSILEAVNSTAAGVIESLDMSKSIMNASIDHAVVTTVDNVEAVAEKMSEDVSSVTKRAGEDIGQAIEDIAQSDGSSTSVALDTLDKADEASSTAATSLAHAQVGKNIVAEAKSDRLLDGETVTDGITTDNGNNTTSGVLASARSSAHVVLEDATPVHVLSEHAERTENVANFGEPRFERPSHEGTTHSETEHPEVNNKGVSKIAAVHNAVSGNIESVRGHVNAVHELGAANSAKIDMGKMNVSNTELSQKEGSFSNATEETTNKNNEDSLQGVTETENIVVLSSHLNKNQTVDDVANVQKSSELLSSEIHNEVITKQELFTDTEASKLVFQANERLQSTIKSTEEIVKQEEAKLQQSLVSENLAAEETIIAKVTQAEDETVAALELAEASVRKALDQAELTISSETNKSLSLLEQAQKSAKDMSGNIENEPPLSNKLAQETHDNVETIAIAEDAAKDATVKALEIAEKSVKGALDHAENVITAESRKVLAVMNVDDDTIASRKMVDDATVQNDEDVKPAVKDSIRIDVETNKTTTLDDTVSVLELAEKSVRNALDRAEEAISAEALKNQHGPSEVTSLNNKETGKSEKQSKIPVLVSGVSDQKSLDIATGKTRVATENTAEDITLSNLQRTDESVKMALSHAEESISAEMKKTVHSGAEYTAHSESDIKHESEIETVVSTASKVNQFSDSIHERVKREVSSLRDSHQASPRDRSGAVRRGRSTTDITVRKAPLKSDSWESNLRKSTVASSGKTTRTAPLSGTDQIKSKVPHTIRSAKKVQPSAEIAPKTSAGEGRRRGTLRKTKSLAEDSTEESKKRVKKMPSQGSTQKTAISVESAVEAAGNTVVEDALDKARSPRDQRDDSSSEASKSTTITTSSSTWQQTHSSSSEVTESTLMVKTELVHAAATIQDAFREHSGVPVDEDGKEVVVPSPPIARNPFQIEPVLEEIAEEVGVDRQASSRRGSRQDSHGADNEDTSTSESSLSSAATKIQAGFRGHLARRHRLLGGRHGTAGTASTSASMSMSRDSDVGVVRAMSLLEDSEVQRHQLDPLDQLPEADEYGPAKYVAEVHRAHQESQAAHKGVEWARSLDSGLSSGPERHTPVRSAVSMQQRVLRGPDLDEHIWRTLEQEMQEGTDDSGQGEGARLMSRASRHHHRRSLHRGNAMQLPTTSSSTPGSLDETHQEPRHTGEFHDVVVLHQFPPDPAQQQQPPQQQPPGTGRAGFTSSPQLSEARPAEAPPQQQQPPQQEVHVAEADAEADAEAPGGATAAAPPPLGGDAPSASPSEGAMKTAEAAATKIQAGFRGYKVRRQLREQSQDQSVADGGDDGHGTDTGAASNGQQGQHAGQQCRSVGVHHHDMMESGLAEPGLEGLDDELLQRSAARIQAGVRGFLVRRRQHNAAQAAAKIQAGFRGYRARRDLKQRVRVGKANPSRQ